VSFLGTSFGYICYPTFIKMKHYLSRYSLLILFINILFLSCSKEKKTPEGILKVNKNGIPVMQPLQEEMPKLSADYIQKKKNGVAHFFDKLWSKNNDNVSFLVAQNGQIIYENYLGYANKNKHEAITVDTPLHIASVSKILTSTAILMLVDANKLKLEQKVIEILPEFPYPDVTIQTLLNHRSGMKNYAYFTYNKDVWDIHKTLTNADVVHIMKEKNIPLESKTDTRFAYCNTNYAVLALIIEKITKVPYPQAMQEMIFKPLGMTHTFVFEMDKQKGQVSPSYKGNNMELAVEYLDGVYGDKNIYSTPRDLLKFDKARYAPYFLNTSLLKKVYCGYSHECKGERNYGLGVRMIEFKDHEPFYYHNGWWHGNTSSFLNLRKEKVTIIAISNKYTKKTYQSKKLAALFGDYPFKLSDDGEE
jgi:CubicO group peptidase (beta-lactamase class C family)